MQNESEPPEKMARPNMVISESLPSLPKEISAAEEIVSHLSSHQRRLVVENGEADRSGLPVQEKEPINSQETPTTHTMPEVTDVERLNGESIEALSFFNLELNSSTMINNLDKNYNRKQREFIPDNNKDEQYWEKRRKNNEVRISFFIGWHYIQPNIFYIYSRFSFSGM